MQRFQDLKAGKNKIVLDLDEIEALNGREFPDRTQTEFWSVQEITVNFRWIDLLEKDVYKYDEFLDIYLSGETQARNYVERLNTLKIILAWIRTTVPCCRSIRFLLDSLYLPALDETEGEKTLVDVWQVVRDLNSVEEIEFSTGACLAMKLWNYGFSDCAETYIRFVEENHDFELTGNQNFNLFKYEKQFEVAKEALIKHKLKSLKIDLCALKNIKDFDLILLLDAVKQISRHKTLEKLVLSFYRFDFPIALFAEVLDSVSEVYYKSDNLRHLEIHMPFWEDCKLYEQSTVCNNFFCCLNTSDKIERLVKFVLNINSLDDKFKPSNRKFYLAFGEELGEFLMYETQSLQYLTLNIGSTNKIHDISDAEYHLCILDAISALKNIKCLIFDISGHENKTNQFSLMFKKIRSILENLKFLETLCINTYGSTLDFSEGKVSIMNEYIALLELIGNEIKESVELKILVFNLYELCFPMHLRARLIFSLEKALANKHMTQIMLEYHPKEEEEEELVQLDVCKAVDVDDNYDIEIFKYIKIEHIVKELTILELKAILKRSCLPEKMRREIMWDLIEECFLEGVDELTNNNLKNENFKIRD